MCRYAQSVGANHFHTSAKSNKGLDDVFADLAQSKTVILYFVISSILRFNFPSTCVKLNRRFNFQFITKFSGILEKKGKGVPAGSLPRQKLVIVDDTPPPKAKTKTCC